jgi:hypothetical protein
VPLPRIAQAEDQLGFHWLTLAGEPVDLPELMLLDEEPERRDLWNLVRVIPG